MADFGEIGLSRSINFYILTVPDVRLAGKLRWTVSPRHNAALHRVDHCNPLIEYGAGMSEPRQVSVEGTNTSVEVSCLTQHTDEKPSCSWYSGD